jgi:hypothetical protein
MGVRQSGSVNIVRINLFLGILAADARTNQRDPTGKHGAADVVPAYGFFSVN